MFSCSSARVVFLFCICCVVTIKCDSQNYMKREYCLMKPYADERWDFLGSTIISSNTVRLTSDIQSQRGSIWSKIPCKLHYWEMHIHFKVHGHGKDLFGDGFAIWYTKDRMITGPVFGNMDKFTGLAVFFDTYANQNGQHNHIHPYVSAMINNGSTSYDHDRDGTHTELDGCAALFREARFETFAAIRYHNDKLTVSLDIDGKNIWKSCFSVDKVRLPTGYFFGASAATGDLSDNHDIVSIKVYDTSEDDSGKDYSDIKPSADFFAPPRDHVEDPKVSSLSNWKLIGIIIIGLVGVAVCAMIGYVLYSRSQQNSRKRFY